MTPALIATKAAIDLITEFEGVRLEAYKDGGGVLTIGYGHTGAEVASGLTWTLEDAQRALQEDVMWASEAVNRLVLPSLHQNQFDALVSLVFNIGSRNFEHSTLRYYLNEKQWLSAGAQFTKWIYSGGKIVPGLSKRRLAEQTLFNTKSGV